MRYKVTISLKENSIQHLLASVYLTHDNEVFSLGRKCVSQNSVVIYAEVLTLE